MLSTSFVALLASASLVAGHGIVTAVNIGGKEYSGTKNYDTPENDKSPVRGIPNNLGFVDYRNVNKPEIACSSAGFTPRKLTPEAPAGSQVGVRWGGDGGPDGKQWPHPEGPAIAYLASCNGPCNKFDPSNAQFFKIHEEGLDTSKRPNAAGNDHTPAGDGLWAQNRIQYENSWNWVTIPADIKAGEYLLRHELISLHGAHTRNEGAQYYPACIQIKVTGGGNATPATTPATALYTVDDGIVNVWEPYPKGIKSYKIPGPPVYKAGAVAAPPPAASTTLSVAPTTSKAVTTTQAPTTSKAPTGQNPAPTPQPTTTKSGPKSCKAKRSARNALRDESRAVYERAAARAAARRAHAGMHASH